jgi:hypothetical protein
LPYALLVASISAITYVIGGLCVSIGGVFACLIMWVVALALFVGAVYLIKFMEKKKDAKNIAQN